MTKAAIGAAAIALVAVVGVLLWWGSTGQSPPASGSIATGMPIGSAASAGIRSGPPLAMGASPIAVPASIPLPPPAPPAVPLGSNEVPDLRADAEGRLVVDAHTRDELEKLLALNDRAAAQALLGRLDAVLPPTAYRQAVDAFFAYQNYSIAAAQLTPPTQPVADETGASQQLDALHALRVQQFGAEVAQAYFGDEEATARRLLAEMRARPAGGSTLEERAEQAQQALSSTR